MHDPMVVAFTIPRLWPERSHFRGAPGDARWKIRHHHEHFNTETNGLICDGCDRLMTSTKQVFPWYKIGSYSKFWRLAGRDFYWPSIITVWHVEPGGHDALSVCQSRHFSLRTGKWYYSKSWKYHFWHWKIQVHSIQNLRRYLLTRCEVCGGKSRKGHVVNFSNSWNNPKTHFWQGELGLRHGDCDARSNR